MSARNKGLLLGGLQILIVLSLGAKLLYDRARCPRVWVLSEVYDPNLPIRGRYLSQRLQFPAEGLAYKEPKRSSNGHLAENEWYLNRVWAGYQVRDGYLIAQPDDSGSAGWVYLSRAADGSLTASTEEPALIFIPDTANTPTLQRGQSLWVEVTVPKKGPPRPIRLGVKKDSVITPLALN